MVILHVIMESVGQDVMCVMVMMTVEIIVMKLDVVVQVCAIYMYNVQW